MDFLVGGVAACGAGFFTNPLEVVKTRMQLQGELRHRGHFAVHYRNVFHAFYTIGRVDGILALQKGLVPAIWYQFCMNGIRLGAFQWMYNRGWMVDSSGNLSFIRCVVNGAFSGCLGAICGSPLYMVKTHLQSMARKEIAVGYQHEHTGMNAALRHIYIEHGMLGLWRGVTGAAARVTVGSSAQLATFSTTKKYVVDTKLFAADSYMNTFLASMLSGCVTVAAMTPFDVISTRLYNQGTDTHGRGLTYSGLTDCFIKILRAEGLWGFYKGWAASLFRVGPHTVLTLVFWDEVKKVQRKVTM